MAVTGAYTDSQGAQGAAKTAASRSDAARWALGMIGTWVVLTALAELDTTAELAVALAVVVAGSVLMKFGPDALKTLGFLT